MTKGLEKGEERESQNLQFNSISVILIKINIILIKIKFNKNYIL